MRGTITAALGCLLFGNVCWANSGGPPNERAGDPPTSLNCTACHIGTANSGSGSLSITGLPSAYEPGATYNLTLALTGTLSPTFGFQAIAKSGDNAAGTLAAVSSGMAIDGDYAESNTRSSSGQWNFQWTAPSTDVGSITFYAAGVATGGAATESGDSVYTMTQSFDAALETETWGWTYQTGGNLYSSPAVDENGTIYVGSGDNKLYAIEG
ncbi:MAG: choice-of-anchor V domain-containing protein, partial [Opitutales bacterium]